MCISSNSVNQAQDLMSVTKIEDFPNSLLPNIYVLLHSLLYALYYSLFLCVNVCCLQGRSHPL